MYTLILCNSYAEVTRKGGGPFCLQACTTVVLLLLLQRRMQQQ